MAPTLEIGKRRNAALDFGANVRDLNIAAARAL